MATENTLREPWLIAVWPGMGNVALAAGTYLVEQLQAQPVSEFAAPDLFEIQAVEIKDGIARAGRLPRSVFFEWEHPDDGQDLLIFVGEAQPATGGYQLCHKLLDYAQKRGVKKFFTFAAMATQLHPKTQPRVFAVATEKESLQELKKHDVEILEDGQISGLNGVLLAAGAERGLTGVSLLGELPYFAVGVPNPKASKAVLEVFQGIADINIDFDSMNEQAEAGEEFLMELMERLQEASQQSEGDEPFVIPEFDPEDTDSNGEDEEEQKIDATTRQRIEALFDQAQKDRSKAFNLKRELDRLGVFKQFENRFLDLFKKAD